MADEFEAGVCGESWWNYPTKSIHGLSACASSINIYDPLIGHLSEFLDMKANSNSDVLHELPEYKHPADMHDKLDSIYYHLQEELNSCPNYRQEKGVNCPELKRNFSSITQHSSLKPVNQDFPAELLQTLLFDIDPPRQPQQSLFPNQNLNATATSLPKQTTPSQFPSPRYTEKPNFPYVTSMCNTEETRQSSSLSKNSSNEPAYKRARIQTPSPLPSFKVRKEKMGDRITALQQLVSPFGKTDTASVLQEAIEYIKFLHDQVNVLSNSCMKNGSTTPSQQEQQGLTGRGLCIVPLSSTFPAVAETTMDFWTPTFT